MRHLSRRSFLKTAANLTAATAFSSVLPALTGCRNNSDTRIRLNVVLHGLFILDFQDNYIDLLTPHVREHVYEAGSWDRKLVIPLGKYPEYGLQGTDAVNEAPFPLPDCNVILSRGAYASSYLPFTVDTEHSFFTIQLPLPAAIHSLRCVDGSNTSGSGGAGAGYEICIHKLSLCQALVYPVSDYRRLELVNTSWKPKVDLITRTANLHLWAEPTKRLTPSHADEAYGKLSELIPPLQMYLKTDRTAPLDSDTGVLGLSPEEEQGLSEWKNGGEGSFPTNCCAAMVTQ